VNKSDFFHSLLLDNIYDGVFFVSNDCKILYWNKGAKAITGYSKEDVIGHYCREEILMHVDESGNEICRKQCPIKLAINNENPQSMNIYGKHKDGHRIPLLVKVVPVKNEKGELIGGVEMFSDDTRSKNILEKVDKLSKIAFIDHLTLLPNRRMMESRLRESLCVLNRHKFSFALCYMDIDHFKSVNDSYGHLVGDRVLKMVANTIKGTLRGYDTAGRWGGEEFLILSPFLQKKEHLESLANRLRKLVRESRFQLNGHTINVTVSVGGVLAQFGDDFESILKRVDELLYECKSRGRDKTLII